MKVIFLDVDGVLTSDDYMNKDTYDIDPEKVKLLYEIIKDTDAKVILNSTYKKYKDVKDNNLYNTLEKILNKYSIDIYDITPVLKEKYKKLFDEETGLQIIGDVDPYTTRAGAVYKWLSDHDDVESFVIIDDILSYYDFFGYNDNLVLTDSATGLTVEDVNNSVNVLNGNKKIR